jgi:DNA polymerase-1
MGSPLKPHYFGRMAKKLFLLDAMALIYRAHFAFVTRPIFTSKRVNTSALYGFTVTLLELIKTGQPSHIAVVSDTAAPTARHVEYPEYKAQRDVIPEDIVYALPHVRRMVEAFRIPFLTCDGYEADDIIGTLVHRAEKEGFESFMVTPDKDFGQLVSDRTFLYKPSRTGEGVEILGVPEVLLKWGIERPAQVIDILGLWGDASDNIPGVPGIGEKTASKLIAEYGSVENLLAHTADLKGKLKENLQTYREQALLSKRLATININSPCNAALDELKLRDPDNDALKQLFIEFEFNSLGRRLLGDDFKAGRGFESAPAAPVKSKQIAEAEDLVLVSESDGPEPEQTTEAPPAPVAPNLKTIADVPHDYRLITTAKDRADLVKTLRAQKAFCLDTETTSLDVREARIIGIAFSFKEHAGFYVALPTANEEAKAVLDEFRAVLEDEKIEKVGHNLKYDISVLKWHGIEVGGRLFDTMIAHSLTEPDMRHGMDYLSEVYLGYTAVPITRLIGDEKGDQINMSAVAPELVADYSAEDADVTWQLRGKLEPLLKEKGQERVFYEIEAPLTPVLADMEFEGIRVDRAALEDYALQLAKEMATLEKEIYLLAGTEFNLNSPKQLGELLFDILKIGDKPRKTRTGQYATDEQTLLALAPDHAIVQKLLDYRAATKLKSTYADALPGTIWPATGRVHTTFNQVVTATGRLNSQNPNLQNIPIRTEKGREIRKAFVPRGADHVLLSADYSQIELRIIAALSRETSMLEAFRNNLDIHTATAAGVYSIPLDQVTSEMRRKAKMVNYGIAYGISAFGLSQRLGIPRKEAASIIEQYFARFPGIARYMSDTIAGARKLGYVETVTGRRRYLRDIRSANATIRGAAERNAINAPIQGTAADMIKLAMINIHRELERRSLKTRMLLQVHDELVFDVPKAEERAVRPIIEDKMANAIKLDVPIVVEIGSGVNWLEAH